MHVMSCLLQRQFQPAQLSVERHDIHGDIHSPSLVLTMSNIIAAAAATYHKVKKENLSSAS
jgi:hypothetical protein